MFLSSNQSSIPGDYVGHSPRQLAQAAQGAPFMDGDHHRTSERCTILGVDTNRYVCTVWTAHGSLLDVPIPEGGDRIPEIDSTDYAVSYTYGAPVLVHAAPRPKTPEAEGDEGGYRATHTETGGDDPALPVNDGASFRGSRPKDLLPGDWVKSGSLGNAIGVLEGGVVLLKANELAQIILTQAKSMLRMLGKSIVMDTGMGSIRMVTEDGKSTLSMELGGDEATEGSPDAENFRIRAELGTEGELVDFRVTDAVGRVAYRMYVDPDGRVQTVMRSRVEVVEGNSVSEVEGGLTQEIGGSRAISVAGNSETDITGSERRTVAGQSTEVAGGDKGIGAGRDLSLNAIRTVNVIAGGQALGGADAVNVIATNGDVSFDIGAAANGDTQVRRSGFSVQTRTGDTSFSTIAGAFSVKTPLPGMCKLGGPSPGLFSPVLYEFFRSMMRTIGIYFDTHTHTIIAPTPATPVTPPVVPMSPVLSALLPLTKSKFVRMGG